MRWVPVLIALLAAGCGETIVLGSECPTRSGACPSADGGQGGLDAQSPIPGPDATVTDPNPNRDGGKIEPTELDAGGLDASQIENDAAASLRDAGPPEDSGPGIFPRFLNPSFELMDGGVEGELQIGTRNSSPIPPWYMCRPNPPPGAVNSSVGEIGPRDGKTFYTDSMIAANYAGLAQDLIEPLQAGRHYAFAVDLWSEPDMFVNSGQPVLEVLATGPGCTFVPGTLSLGVRLGVSAPVEPSAWKTVCVDLYPAREVHAIMLMVNPAGGFLNFTAKLHIDNIRSDPKCNEAQAP